MKIPGVIGCCLAALATLLARTRGADDFLDRVGDALTTTAWHDTVRARLSGSVNLDGYRLQQPAPGLIFADGANLFSPRLTLLLDAQFGRQMYIFAQTRADRAFDPSDEGTQVRLDEYALRITPWPNAHFSLQIGKFATVVGNWVPRHGVWDDPFITAPLPYENLTGLWDVAAARSSDVLLAWAHVRPGPSGDAEYADKYLRLPMIWGPSYASGAALFGEFGKMEYAVELKNAALSSRPETWDATRTQWQHPTFSGRLGYRPNVMWNLGFSASTGSFLRPSAQPTLAAGHGLGDYREIVLGQDIGFAWHHLQLWAEFYATRFEIPLVGNVGTWAYYLEAKYKFTPQFFGALRWNQQWFSTVSDSAGESVPWGRAVWRLDLASGYRFTPHTELKLQYSLQHEAVGSRDYSHLLAAQFVVRF
ncbi:MAG: hypothetical protein PHE83_05095 [Opitutaceae bacterium]|nr:hypothetical protein [Opitutaceae bacterium]